MFLAMVKRSHKYRLTFSINQLKRFSSKTQKHVVFNKNNNEEGPVKVEYFSPEIDTEEIIERGMYLYYLSSYLKEYSSLLDSYCILHSQPPSEDYNLMLEQQATLRAKMIFESRLNNIRDCVIKRRENRKSMKK